MIEIFSREIGLPELKETKSLEGMVLLQKGSRLSVQPVKKKEYDTILKMASR